MKKILVIAAHPDDEVLGCGGTMARLTREGNRVYTIILGEGITSRDEKRDTSKRKKELRSLRDQAKKANTLLGVKRTFIFDLPDNRFDTVALLDIVKTLEKVKKEVKPDIVYTHSYGDLNIDHRITFEAVLTAFRPVKGESVKEIYSFEVPSSTEWAFGRINSGFRPNVFIDINDSLNLKLKAMGQYKTEKRTFPHPRSAKALRTVAGRWGTVSGCDAAEAFELIRKNI
jgi:LmbE family N-acetylglucosaminyl deacetylase